MAKCRSSKSTSSQDGELFLLAVLVLELHDFDLVGVLFGAGILGAAAARLIRIRVVVFMGHGGLLCELPE